MRALLSLHCRDLDAEVGITSFVERLDKIGTADWVDAGKGLKNSQVRPGELLDGLGTVEGLKSVVDVSILRLLTGREKCRPGT